MKIIDLTALLYTGMDVYPGDPEVKIEPIHSYDNQGWLLRLMQMGSHTGTHVDAFSHMDENGGTLDDMPVSRFCGRARLVNMNNVLPRKIGLVFNTGNLDETYLTKILDAKTPFVAIGDDTGMTIEMERALLKNGVVTFTRLINCEQLPDDKAFFFIGLPLRIQEGDGSPIRAIAIVDFPSMLPNNV